MDYIAATDAKQAFGLMLEKAQRAPVTITRQSRAVAVMMSPAQYARLTQLNLEEFQRYRQDLSAKVHARGLTPAKLKKLLSND